MIYQVTDRRKKERRDSLRRAFALAGSLLTICIVLLGLLWLSGIPSAQASTTSIRYVAPGGNCGGATPCYSTIQAAVNAAGDGDTIKVAAGTYTDTQTLTASDGYTYTQIVLVDGKNLTLKGGYTTSDWNIYDPLSNPTIIDARGYGRGVTVLGDGTQTVTVAGFQIVNGDYTNLGNPAGVSSAACPSTGGDCAGGLLAHNVKLILQDALIRNNTASRIRPYSRGGGALLWGVSGGTLLENVQVFSNTNTVEGYGGGLDVHYATGAITITNSQFDQNHSTFDGGGLLIQSVNGPVVIRDSRFVGNTAVGRDDAEGGAIAALVLNDLLLDRVEFRDNRAAEDGAAMLVRKVGTLIPTVRLVNVLAAENRLTNTQEYGSVFNFVGGTASNFDFNIRIVHATVAENQAPGGIRFAQWPINGTSFGAYLTNTLIASATYGLVGAHYTNTLAITHTNTLFYNVTNQTGTESGTPIFNGSGTVTGDPKLDGNQRLQAGSAAIDAGVNSGVTLDLDGGVRPAGAGYDIGADEYAAASPGSLRFSQATYAVAEGGSLLVTVERVGGTSGTVGVQYASSDGTATAGSDYTAISGTLTFADGETSKTFTLTTLQDSTDEPDETLVLSLGNPTGGATLGSPNQSVVTIQDDDVSAAGQLQFASGTFTVTESSGQATITVVRTNGSDGTVSVQYVTNNGTATAGDDYIAASGTLTFADGETSKTFTVTILRDTLSEGYETVLLALSNPTGGATLGSPNQAVLRILDRMLIYLPLVVR